VKVDDILDPAAVDLLASRLRTPLQIEQHLTLALETGYQASEKPVTEAIADSVLSKQIDDLEPTLTRHGYSARVLTEMAPRPRSCAFWPYSFAALLIRVSLVPSRLSQGHVNEAAVVDGRTRRTLDAFCRRPQAHG
jgi:hypothetical protein